MNCDLALLEASYACCRHVSRASGSNFYHAFWMLSRPKRKAMDALYAFMRHTDDLGDNSSPVAARQAALAEWRTEVTAALAGQLEPRPDRLLLPALTDTVRRFGIPSASLLAVLDGVQMDLDNRRYETFDELAEYCRRVASAVGRACIHVWGFRGDEVLEPADRCGLALQLTNILRDLREDCQQGRVYLPLEELRQCDYSVDDLAAGVADSRFLRLMELQSERAERLYREGARLFEGLNPDGRRIFGVMMTVYYRLLQQIRRQPAAVLSGRVSLGKLQKTCITARWLLWPPNCLVLS